MISGPNYKVVIRHNLVVAVQSVEVLGKMEEITESLHAAVQLAENFRKDGCIDGDYVFPSVHRAKDFAIVALDFFKKLIEKSEERLSTHNFYADSDWFNTSVAKN